MYVIEENYYHSSSIVPSLYGIAWTIVYHLKYVCIPYIYTPHYYSQRKFNIEVIVGVKIIFRRLVLHKPKPRGSTLVALLFKMRKFTPRAGYSNCIRPFIYSTCALSALSTINHTTEFGYLQWSPKTLERDICMQTGSHFVE